MKRATGEEEQSAGTGVVTAGGPVLSPVPTRLDPVPGKFQIPSQPESYVQRSRLFEELELGVGGPLTLVSSPAGSGKTVLVSAWASRAQAQRRLVWVSLEARDLSRTGFWSILTEALRRCGVVIPSGAQSPTEEMDDGYVDLVVSAVHEAAQPGQLRPVVVVLDCDMAVPAAVAHDLDLLLRRSRGWLRLVLLTRVDPVLPLHRYRLDGSLVEVRMPDLAFTLPEARELMTRAGVVLSGAALQALVDRTQGWAAGLRFAAVSLSGRDDQDHAALGFSGHTGNVAEYLIAEVLDSQPVGGRQLLLETSVVDVLRPGLCEAVAGPHAQRSLDRLVRGNAFLTELADAPGCYRYQPLFLELLRSQLAGEMPQRVPELHRAAAAWMFDQGRVEGAVRHAAAAGDWQNAARYVIEDLAIGHLLVPSGGGCAEVLARLPEDLEGVAASVVRAALAIAAFNVEACEEHLLRAESELEGVRTLRWHSAALAVETVRLAHAAAVANPEEGLAAAAAAERLMRLQPSDRLEEHPELSVLIASGRGAAWLAKGSLDDAAEAFSAGARAADRSGCESLLIHCLGHLALLAAIRGQLRKANELAARVALVQQEARIDEASCPTASVAMAWVNTELYDLPVAR